MKILITGATSGIGRQLAVDYQASGHEVTAVGRSADALDALAGHGLHTLRLDLLDREATLQGLAALDRVDLAILCAGSCEYIDMPHFDSALVSRIMRLNVETLAHSIEGVLPALRRSDSPHLVGIGSSAAYLPLPRAEAYGTSKAAVAYLMDTLAITLAPENIRVSLVCPGFVKTPLTDKNDFSMPFLMDVQSASNAIRKGIEKKKGEIHFPKKLTWGMKVAAQLPRSLWAVLARRMIQS
jgi:short-subunit dehydrogenase